MKLFLLGFVLVATLQSEYACVDLRTKILKEFTGTCPRGHLKRRIAPAHMKTVLEGKLKNCPDEGEFICFFPIGLVDPETGGYPGYPFENISMANFRGCKKFELFAKVPSTIGNNEWIKLYISNEVGQHLIPNDDGCELKDPHLKCSYSFTVSEAPDLISICARKSENAFWQKIWWELRCK
ncbi:MAG: hypothetical protein NZT61_00465 [Deltaproteobacteria bacterium]|nr:hypothetical protein [Deltaproteobacteria bacterium]